jgi:hypothetical protein
MGSPASGKIKIVFEKPIKSGNIGLYNPQGRCVLRNPIESSGNHITVDVSRLTKGFYLLKAETDKGFYATKILIH